MSLELVASAEGLRTRFSLADVMTSVKRCPVCLSYELELYMGGQFGKYRCKSCGYLGPLVVEQEIPELEELERTLRKREGKHGKRP